MSDVADYRSILGRIKTTYTYDKVETIDAIIAEIKHITSTYVEQVALVTIMLHFDSAERVVGAPVDSLAGPLANQSLHPANYPSHLMDHLRPLVRKTDSVFLLEHTLYFVLLGSNQQGAQIVQARLWEALLWYVNNVSDPEALHLYSITIGHSAYPTPYSKISKFILAANEIVLCFDRQPERPPRKAVARRSTPLEPQDVDEELPAVARKLGVPYVSFLPSEPPDEVQHLLNPELAQELQCYPLGRERNMLTVAMLNPRDHSVLDRLHQETGLLIFPVLTPSGVLQTALKHLIC